MSMSINEMSYFEIVKVAALVLAVDGTDQELSNKLEYALDNMSSEDIRLSTLASKMLEGKRYRVVSSNPEIVARYRALARYMGANENVFEEQGSVEVFGTTVKAKRGVARRGVSFTDIVFTPPARQ